MKLGDLCLFGTHRRISLAYADPKYGICRAIDNSTAFRLSYILLGGLKTKHL